MPTESKSIPAPPSQAHSSFPKGWVILLASIVAVAAGGTVWWGHEHRANASNEGAGEGKEPSGEGTSEGVHVAVVRPQRGGLMRTSTQPGSLIAFEQADLYAKVSGYLKMQAVDIGSKVKKGDVLAEIDDPEIVKEADRAEKAVKHAKTLVTQARARIKAADAEVKAAEADIASAVSRRHFREKELARYKDLRKREAVPQQIVDEYEEHFESAIAQERSAEAALASAKAKVDLAKSDLEEAEANVEVMTEVLEKDRVFVNYTKIVSPYTGVITARNFFVGDFIRAADQGNERVMLTAARIDKMRVVTYVPDRDVPFTDVGDKAIVKFDALPGMTFEGTVSRFSYTEDKQSRTMRTEIDLENPKGLLREGMYGEAMIVLEANTTSMTIPSGCITGKTEDGSATVFIVKDGRARLAKVKLGTDNGIRVEVTSGLTAEDQVITTKGSLVTEDVPVIIEEPEKGAPAKNDAA